MEHLTIILANLEKQGKIAKSKGHRHKRSYFRLEYKNKYPHPEKYF